MTRGETEPISSPRATLLESLNIQKPIIQGGMGNISPVELCVAVTQAGGLGQIGAGTLSVDELKQKIEMVQNHLQPNASFGVNIPLNVHPQLQDVIQLVIEKQVPIVSLSAGNPKPFIAELKERGRKVMVVVATVEQGKKAESCGADVVIGEGFEAAGKNSPKELTTLALIPQLTKALQIPVVAAGGIADGQGLLAAFAMGAAGVQLGTRLVMTKEATLHERYKDAILNASDEDTIVLGRSYGFVTRLLHTPYAKSLLQREKQGIRIEDLLSALDEKSHRLGAQDGELDQGHVNAGQISGFIDSIPSVRELFEDMELVARRRLEEIRSDFYQWEDKL
ncbi:NAD(P)H-dependent flavin oxidoreductase [Bacillus horti]|nr:nitronate monooxygenase [Bacillus horti]